MKTSSRAALIMALPAVVLFFVFNTIPTIQGVFYSFTNSRGYGKWNFVGLDNYVRLFGDADILHSYLFTFQFAIVSTIAVNIISILLALALSANIKFRSFMRSVYFFPAVLSVIVVSYIFNTIFSSGLPQIGEALGIPGLATNILGSEDTAWIGIVVVSVWKACATTTVIYIAGLQTIPEEVVEAALLDGAGAWKRFWSITFPLITAFFVINMVLSFKDFLQVFDQIVALTAGGPGTSTQSISFLIYKAGFAGGEFGYQSANAVIYFVVIAVLSLFQLRILRPKGRAS
ncbi:carbohydrate ABC transporter permease [Mycetocola sp. JXN-3]|uniref:carbohydrate ABC transporter permease n=1 Tax=Mycetocola sp. JXN-3 TaxID=2116510 RepID=UPI0021077634|nr:sugar ABC transporter permease [Mycetocola sp. JXN-3]